jgi:hypothetical protein
MKCMFLSCPDASKTRQTFVNPSDSLVYWGLVCC